MDGSAGGTEQWVERCDPLLRWLLRRHPVGPPADDVDDLLQEARLKLWRTRANGRPIEHWPAYIRTIVNSVVMDRQQRSARERALSAAAGSSALADDARACRGAEALLRERIQDAESAIVALPGPRRTVLQMTLAGYSLGEISALRNWTPKKTYHLYERGVKDLKKRLAATALLAGIVAATWLVFSPRPASEPFRAGTFGTSGIGPIPGAALAGRLFEKPDGFLDRVSRTGLILNADFDQTAYMPSTRPAVLASFDIASGGAADPIVSGWSLARFADSHPPDWTTWRP
jgi:RNA polymerase sigma factor (sigma-70 family)